MYVIEIVSKCIRAHVVWHTHLAYSRGILSTHVTHQEEAVVLASAYQMKKD